MSKNHKHLTLPLHHAPSKTLGGGPIEDPDVQLRVGPKSSACLKAFGKAIAFGIFGVAVFYASFCIWTRFAPGHHDGLASFVSDYTVVAESGTHTSHRQFPFDPSRELHINVIGGATRVLISEADTSPSPKGIWLDTTWIKEESEVEFGSSDKTTTLAVTGSASSAHAVRVFLPSNSTVIPRLTIRATRLSLAIDPPGPTVTFGNLLIDTDELSYLPKSLYVQDDLEISAHQGNIRGSFTFSRRLALRVNTGNIGVGVNILHPDPHGIDPATLPPIVDARTRAGDIALEVLSQADGVESNITAVTGVGVVSITQKPEFEGSFEADVDRGVLEVSTKAPKVLHFTEENEAHVRGYVVAQHKFQSTGSHTSPRVHCHSDLADEPSDQDESSLTIQTDPPYLEQSFSIQTDPPYPEPTFTTVGKAHAHTGSATTSAMSPGTWQYPQAPLPNVRSLDFNEEREQDDEHHRSSASRPHQYDCEQTELDTEAKACARSTKVDDLPKGGLVKASAHMGVVELRL